MRLMLSLAILEQRVIITPPIAMYKLVMPRPFDPAGAHPTAVRWTRRGPSYGLPERPEGSAGPWKPISNLFN